MKIKTEQMQIDIESLKVGDTFPFLFIVNRTDVKEIKKARFSSVKAKVFYHQMNGLKRIQLRQDDKVFNTEEEGLNQLSMNVQELQNEVLSRLKKLHTVFITN